jgi:hypothetical protein
MERTAKELREDIAAKQAYGVKTTRLENELYRMKRAALPKWRRKLNDALGAACFVACLVFLWGLILSPVLVKVFALLFN